MQVFVYKNAEEVARAAATVFAAEIFKKPDCVLGLATRFHPGAALQGAGPHEPRGIDRFLPRAYL